MHDYVEATHILSTFNSLRLLLPSTVMKATINRQYPLSELTGEIIGAAMEVHRQLGNGFPELIYQRALAVEFKVRSVNFIREKSIDIFYKGENVGSRQPDFIVEDQVIVELKAVATLENPHIVQALNYLEAYHLKIGLLINFGGRSLEFRRLFNNR